MNILEISDLTVRFGGLTAVNAVSLDVPEQQIVSVIGPNGEAHGLKDLYIADSSIFPTSLGVNPQYTTMAMSTILGRGILADWGA